MADVAPPTRGPWWLSRTAMISLAGLALSAVFVAFLGWYIPRRVADDFLIAQSAADQASLDFLVSSDMITAEAGLDIEELDGFVRQSILRGDFVRAKLWAVDGTILYSDAPELIGQRFEPDEDFDGLLSPISQVSDLGEEENYLEAATFGGLLETYVPVLDGDRVLAVWEVYRTLDAYNESVEQTQRLVWLGVGSGLGLLGLFLVSALGLLVRTADEHRQDAEARMADLVTLLEVARTTTEADSPEALADRLRPVLQAAPQVRSAMAVVEGERSEPRVLLDVGESEESDRDGMGIASAEARSGVLTVRIGPSPEHRADPTVDADAEEVLVGLQKALLSEGLDDYRRQLEDVMEKLVDAEDSERRRLAGDIHDSIAQDLYRILYGVRGLAANASDANAQALAEIEDVVLKTSESLRALLRDLYPTVAEDVGLAAALTSLADRITGEYGLEIDLDIDRCPEPPTEVKLAVYRVAQEALINAAKHSGSDRAELTVWGNDDEVLFRVSDSGAGPDVGWQPGMGVWLMRERITRLGGQIEFATGHGMDVSGAIPWAEDA